MKRLAAAAALAAALTALGSPAEAGRVDPPGQHANSCVTPRGTDLNELFGVPEQFINRYCNTLSAGEYWREFATWVTDDGVDSVYPADYVPLHADPFADFLAKLTAVKVVIDDGTPRERTYTYSVSDAVRTDVSAPDGLPMAVTMPRIAPLSVGDHTRDLVWVLSARHCDGLGVVEEENCLPAGELRLGILPLTVATPELT